MFGLFTIQMPAAIQTRVADVSNQQAAGTFGGVALMGVLSALIVTTCVGPALVGALIVIGQTGQIARGAAALFAMSIGMGTPLLIVGASAGKLLPKAGAWMDTVKKLFGVMMLAVAAWMLARIIPERLSLVLWAIPALVCAWLLLTEIRKRSAATWVVRFVGAAAGVYGLALITGIGAGRHRPARAVRIAHSPPARAAFPHDQVGGRPAAGNHAGARRKDAPCWSTSPPSGVSPVRRWRSTRSPTRR